MERFSKTVFGKLLGWKISGFGQTLIPQDATLPINFKSENIWDAATMERFLNIIYNDSVSFASLAQISPMKTNREFEQYVLKDTKTKISELRLKSPKHYIKSLQRLSMVDHRFLIKVKFEVINKQNKRRYKLDYKMLKHNLSKIRNELHLKHFFDGSELNVYDTSIISLSMGAPGPELLHRNCEIFKVATEHRMNHELQNNSYLFQYGPAVGIPTFRQELAKFLCDCYQDEVNPNLLVVTHGATGGLHLILSTLLDMSGYVFVDEVTYMIALESISQFSNMKIIPIPIGEDGVNVDELKKQIQKFKFSSKSKLFWGVYYTIPIFHNPTGILFSADVCNQLIQISREHDILIACDDVYSLLHYTDKIPKRLFAYDNMSDPAYKGNVISNGSFSKILSPGIRVGWMECPPRCLELLRSSGIMRSGGGMNGYTSGLVTSLIELGLMKQQLTLFLETYKERMLTVCDILKKQLSTTCKFNAPLGGFFIWIELPPWVDGDVFNKFCKENYKVSAIDGERFSVEKKFKNFVRISIAFHRVDVLKMSVLCFCKAVNEYISMKSEDERN